MSILSALTWLGNTPWSIALHESLYVWPTTELLHVLTLALFVGTAVMLDLRLLGAAFTRIPISEFTSRLLPWTRAGFAVMVVTGLMLFYATPVTYYQSLFFRVKVVLIVAALINIVVFHERTMRTLPAWDAQAQPPRAARIAAIVSLIAWSGVVVTGRMIAYNWFACDLPQPAWVILLAGCTSAAP